MGLSDSSSFRHMFDSINISSDFVQQVFTLRISQRHTTLLEDIFSFYAIGMLEFGKIILQSQILLQIQYAKVGFRQNRILFRLKLSYNAHLYILYWLKATNYSIYYLSMINSLHLIKSIRIGKLTTYNFSRRTHFINYLMDKASIQETLRRSREVEERYKKFMAEKAQTDKQWAVTEAKIDKTLDRLAETKDTIKQIDQLYENYQKSFQTAINAALQKIQANKLIQTQDPDFVPQNGTPKEIANLIKKKKKVIFMTGAGVSAASGIPTFRDKDGYWTKKKLENISPEQFLTFSNYEDKPFEIWEWLQDFYKTKSKCKPNKGHVAIDVICNNLLSKKAEACVVTQNIDNFHVESQAQQKNMKGYPIYEVHGNILKVRCDACSKNSQQITFYPFKDYRQLISDKKNAPCPKCQQSLRPHIMFFDQFYQEKFHKSESVKNFAQNADLLVVVGTALQTGLARMTVEQCLTRKIDIVQINTQCMIRQKNVIWMQGKGDEILSKIASEF